MSTRQQLDHLRSLLPLSEVIERDAPGYKEEAAPVRAKNTIFPETIR